MIYIGIDPGKKGAMAIIDGTTIVLVPFSGKDYINTIKQFPSLLTRVCIEHVSAMPNQGVTSMFNFGQNFGYIRGLLEAFGIPYELVRPQKWKKEFGISDKNSSVECCKRLFPGVSLRRTERCRKDDDGLAEALLMAEYARRKM